MVREVQEDRVCQEDHLFQNHLSALVTQLYLEDLVRLFHLFRPVYQVFLFRQEDLQVLRFQEGLVYFRVLLNPEEDLMMIMNLINW